MIGYADLLWKDYSLYAGKKDTKFSVEPFVAFWCQLDDGMFKIRYPDGTVSEDFYNISWAKQHAMEEFLSTTNRKAENGTQRGSTCV